MADVAGQDRNKTRSGDLRHPVDRYLKFTLNYLKDLFLRMAMFVNGRFMLELVVGEGHARRVEIAPTPSWQALDNIETVRANKRHWTSPCTFHANPVAQLEAWQIRQIRIAVANKAISLPIEKPGCSAHIVGDLAIYQQL